MTSELFWLTLTSLMTGMLWIPYIVNRLQELGAPSLAFFPPVDPPARAQWAARAVKAHINAVENLVVFAPLVLTIYFTQSGTYFTATAAKIYFFARFAHYAIGVFGLPIPLRTLAFLTGFACQMTLGVSLLLAK